jgi:hypothetical protein
VWVEVKAEVMGEAIIIKVISKEDMSLIKEAGDV